MIKHFLCLAFYLSVHFGFSQTKSFSIQFENEKLENILELVTASTGYFFSYNTAILNNQDRFTMNVQDITLDEFLNRLFIGTGLEHQVLADQVVIRFKTIVETASVSRKLFSISGQVVDSLNSLPIPGANVFLSGTNIGGVTDLDGYYMIEKIPTGSYEVIFSHLSYDIASQEISQSQIGVRTINAELSFKSNVLDTLEVVSRRLIGPDDRPRYLRIFSNEFLGRSSNANGCKILNPDVLDFIYDPAQDRLDAFALEPIELVNEQLGYEVTYIFDRFTKTGNVIDFYGRAKFVELKAENKRQARSWLRNRKRIYYGSFLHFRRALIDDNLKKEGFRIERLETDDLDKISQSNRERIGREELLEGTSEGFRIKFEGFLEVRYRKAPDEQYREQFFEPTDSEHQISLLRTAHEDGVTLKFNGKMQYPGFETYGYWYWERLGDLLPENYDPENDKIEDLL